MKYNCIVILGPTASGKTKLACELATAISGEIISADSRQVYKGLNIGTGKDLYEYNLDGQHIPYHLIDIVEPNEQYYLHQFVNDLEKTFLEIRSRKKIPIICGGTGLYLDALHKDFSLTQIEENFELRKQLETFSKENLIDKLKTYTPALWQHVDLNSKKRIIRGIEICEHQLKSGTLQQLVITKYQPIYFGINIHTDERKKNISERLQRRLNEGLMEEVESLLIQGISHQRLQKFGLEYKFVSKYLMNELNKDQLFLQLQTAIFQYAKRQMTWFRKMEKEGIEINWLPAGEPDDQLINMIKNLVVNEDREFLI